MKNSDELDELEVAMLEELAESGAVAGSDNAAAELAYRIGERLGTKINGRVRRLSRIQLMTVSTNGNGLHSGIAITKAGCRAIQVDSRLARRPPAPAVDYKRLELELVPVRRPAQSEPSRSAVAPKQTRKSATSKSGPATPTLQPLDRAILHGLADGLVIGEGNAANLLARKLGMVRDNYFSNRLARLDGAGYVDRVMNGKRTYRIAITELGREAVGLSAAEASSTESLEPTQQTAPTSPKSAGPKMHPLDRAILQALLDGPVDDYQSAAGALARRIDVPRTNAFSMRLKLLDDRGHIDRVLEQKRTYHIAITESGREALNAVTQ